MPRGQAENHIKAWKTHLAADRTSCCRATANQMRLFLHIGAYWLLWSLRAAMPRRSAWRVAQFDTLRLRLSQVASPGTPPERTAAWIEGFAADSGLLLVHDSALLDLIDQWLTGLSGRAFVDVLPLLRRTFGGFTAAERRSIAELVVRGGVDRDPAEQPVDTGRAAAAVAAAAAVLGLPAHT